MNNINFKYFVNSCYIKRFVIQDMMPQSQGALLTRLRQQWTCPISLVPVVDPVITTAGNTYERKALEIWLTTNKTDSKSKTELTYCEAIPNIVLQNVINILENELPRQDFELAENQITIKDLNDQVESLQKEIEQERAKGQVSEELLQNTIEGTNKIKKIHKGMVTAKEQQNFRLRQVLGQNQKYRKLICDLRVKEREQEDKIRIQQQEINKITQERSNIEQDAGENDNHFHLLKAWSRAQDDALKEVVSFTNNNFEMAYKYHEKFGHWIIRHFGDVIQGGLNPYQRDIIEVAEQNVVHDLEGQKILCEWKVNNQPGVPELVEKLKRAEEMLDFARMRILMSRGFKKNILQWMTIGDQIHSDIYSALSLKVIPFALPQADQRIEKEIDWRQVIEIHTDASVSVEQDQWNQLVVNSEKFPRLIHLQIENCNFANITIDDLAKFKNLTKLVLKSSQFSVETKIVLEEFEKKYSWIDITVQSI